MTSRSALVRAVLSAVVVVTACSVLACSPGSPTRATASMRSEPRPASEPPDPATPPQESSPPSDLPSMDDLQRELDDLLGPDASIPDLSGPDSERLTACVDLAQTYGELIALALTGDPDRRIDGLVDELAQAMPPQFDDDLRVLRDSLHAAAAGGLLDATSELTSPEFRQATETIATWFSEECGSDGGSGA